MTWQEILLLFKECLLVCFLKYTLVLGSELKLSGEHRIPLYLPDPYAHSLPFYQHPTPEGYICYTDESTLIYHNHLKSIVHIRVCCWSIFNGFRQMWNDTYLTLQYHTKQFHCPRNPLCCPIHAPTNPWQPLIFVLSP